MQATGFAVPRKAIGDLSRYLAELEPDRITTSQAAELYSLFAQIRRLGSAGELLLAPRAAESEDWRNQGHRSAAAWMADTSGTGLGEAMATLDAGERLEALPGTARALRAGELSAPKAREIAAVAAGRPGTEEGLLELAATGTLKALKDECRRVAAVATSTDEEKARHLAIHKGRYFRHWLDPDGAFRAECKLTADQGARLVSAIESRADVLFDEARKAGNHEAPAAYAVDALVELATGTGLRAGPDDADGGRSGAGAVIHIRIDAAALRRGHVGPGEICEIPGIGPVPVATVRALLPESFVKVFVCDGVDIRTVCHVGRSIPARVRSALEERDPVCVVPGCGVAVGLEIDHYRIGFADGGVTALDKLARLCHFHHAMKTYRGFELKGGPGAWEWEPPPEFASPPLDTG